MAWMCANPMFVAVLLLTAGAGALGLVWEAESRRTPIPPTTQYLLGTMILALVLLLLLHERVCQWRGPVMPW